MSCKLLITLAAGAIAWPGTAAELAVELREIPMIYRAAGTVRPKIEANVMAQASGRLLEIPVRDGDRVREGDVVARIADRELTLRISQARRGVEQAQAQQMQAQHGKVGALAGLAQTEAEYERVRKYVERKAATPQDLERAEATYKQAQATVAAAEESIKAAEAGVKRAMDGVAEAEVALEYTTVRAPFSGVVSHRLVDPGDLAWPGRPLLRLMQPEQLRLEAYVREGLAGKIEPGQSLAVELDALGVRVDGRVDEVVPAADPASRTFTVKVSLPQTPRLLPGMFGRLAVPTGRRQVLLVPGSAVVTLGQLHAVRVKLDSGWGNRLVRLGDSVGSSVEVLAGLAPGEIIDVPDGGEAGQ